MNKKVKLAVVYMILTVISAIMISTEIGMNSFGEKYNLRQGVLSVDYVLNSDGEIIINDDESLEHVAGVLFHQSMYRYPLSFDDESDYFEFTASYDERDFYILVNKQHISINDKTYFSGDIMYDLIVKLMATNKE